MCHKILCISRSEVFSPQSVERAFSMISATSQALRQVGFAVEVRKETELQDFSGFDAILSMGRALETLRLLSQAQKAGIPVLNHPSSVALCGARYQLLSTLHEVVPIPHFGLVQGTATPPFSYWLKADGYTTTAFPVQKCPAHSPIVASLLPRCLYMQHVEGTLVKFYGVLHTDFFEACVVSSDISQKTTVGKSATSEIPFKSLSNAFQTSLKDLAEQAAKRVMLDIYGGDAVIDDQGCLWLIDLNDWPSFSFCQNQAAKAIVQRVSQVLGK